MLLPHLHIIIVKEYVERETIKSDFFQGPVIDAMRVDTMKTKIPSDINFVF